MAADEFRPWHALKCPARDGGVADEDVEQCCTCPPERFLDEHAEPIPENGHEDVNTAGNTASGLSGI